ncbi:Imm53 family immunity protein [Chitinophagaceae bacterium MMS25-I14]
MEILTWLYKWFESYCDGDWEHEQMINIQTTSNPGWMITIDLKYTHLESAILDIGTIENGDDDWFFYNIKDSQYRAGGDISKLEFLLNKFREVATEYTNQFVS